MICKLISLFKLCMRIDIRRMIHAEKRLHTQIRYLVLGCFNTGILKITTKWVYPFCKHRCIHLMSYTLTIPTYFARYRFFYQERLCTFILFGFPNYLLWSFLLAIFINDPITITILLFQFITIIIQWTVWTSGVILNHDLLQNMDSNLCLSSRRFLPSL